MDSNSSKRANGFIDLNMPALMEDEYFSQSDVSVVSDLNFYHQLIKKGNAFEELKHGEIKWGLFNIYSKKL